MKKIFKIFGASLLQFSLIVGLLGTVFFSQVAEAANPTGTFEYSTNNTSFSTATNISVNKNGNLWLRWNVQGATSCNLRIVHSPTDREYINGSDPVAVTLKIDTATPNTFAATGTGGSEAYELRCDSATATDFLVGTKNISIVEPAGGQVSPNVPSMYQSDLDCVLGLPKGFSISTTDANNDPIQFEVASDFSSRNDLMKFPSASTYYPTGGSRSISVTPSYPNPSSGNDFPNPDQMWSSNQTGIYTGFDARAKDDKGNTSSWLQDDISTENRTYRTKKCVYNLDNGLSGGDNDGTDLVVRVNGGPWTASNINIQTGDELEFRWNSAMDACGSNSGPGLFISTTAGTDTTITEPTAGNSSTYNLNCNIGGYTQSESITVTNGGIPPPPPPPPSGVSVTLGTYENGVYATGNRNVGTLSVVDVEWSSVNATKCYYTWNGVFRGTAVNSGLGTTPVSPTSNISRLAPPPRNIGDYMNVNVSCQDDGSGYDSKTLRFTTSYAGNAPPSPTATLQARKYTSGSWSSWSSANMNIVQGDIVELKWSSTNADTCYAYAGSGFGPGYLSTSGTDTTITEPTAGSASTFSVECSNDYGNANDSLIVTNTTANSAPNAPTINGPTTGYLGSYYSFGFTATDPQNSTIRYAIDWDNNGTFEQNSAYFASGVTATTTHQWSTYLSTGNKTFCVKAYDGTLYSTPTCHTIAMSPAPPPQPDLKIDDSDGPLNIKGSDSASMNLTWSTQYYSGNCTLQGPGISYYNQTVSSTGGGYIPYGYIPVGATRTYILTCGTGSDSIDVTRVSQYLTFEARENTGTWDGSGTLDVDVGNNVYLRWSYTGPYTNMCVGTNFSTGNSSSNSSKQVTTPTPAGATISYKIQCGRYSTFYGYDYYTTSIIEVTSKDPAVANLTSGSLQLTGGVIEEGAVADFSAEVTNNGDKVSGDFTDTFEYRYGSSGGFTSFATPSNSSLAIGGKVVDTASYTIPSSGRLGSNLYIQHCVDYGGTVTESDETVADNCEQIGPYTVAVAGAGSSNLVPQGIAEDVANVTYDSGTDTLSNVKINSIIRNTGGGTANASQYTVEIDYGADGSYDDSKTGNIGTLAGNNTDVIGTVSFDNVPTGNTIVRLTVNTGSSPITESNTSDNVGSPYSFGLSAVDPGINLDSTEGKIVRPNTITTIDWVINTPGISGMTCTISGPGAPAGNLDLTPDGDGKARGSFTTPPIKGKVTYTVNCAAGAANYKKPIVIESVGSVEEL